jgi:hypothetical protein
LLYRAEFAIRGAFRFSERREACERLIDGDAVILEREPDNSRAPLPTFIPVTRLVKVI